MAPVTAVTAVTAATVDLDPPIGEPASARQPNLPL
jgi:hypothetical protein